MDENFVRCKPCGYVMKESELEKVGVCPACGMPAGAFEPYRERVSDYRKLILDLDIHPIAIHLSQTFVGLAPLLIIVNMIFPNLFSDTFISVTNFSIYVLPFTLILSTVSGAIDGYTRFKTLDSPLLRIKIIYSVIIIALSFANFFVTKPGEFTALTLVLSLACLYCAVRLGLWGKKLLNVIMPGSLFINIGKRKIKV